MQKSDREIMEILEAYKRDGLRVHSAAQRLPGADPTTVRRYAPAQDLGRPRSRQDRASDGHRQPTSVNPVDIRRDPIAGAARPPRRAALRSCDPGYRPARFRDPESRPIQKRLSSWPLRSRSSFLRIDAAASA